MPIVRIINSALRIEVEDDNGKVICSMEVPGVKIDDPEYEVTHGGGEGKGKRFTRDAQTGDVRLKIHPRRR